ncbi:MAG: hypothetical protein MUC62_09365 [Candidatus Thermoplasmatota archaeon]|jgi:hypothetical protein|nr:hypothetical protein [Candidatus Thermoplasmatota archaeon]
MRRSIFDNRGGMEGVPLQLIIVVVVGMAALAILIGWLAFAGDTDPTLKRAVTDPDTIKVTGAGRATASVQVQVFVYDSEGDEVDGAVVTFTGAVDQKVTQKVDSGDKVALTAALAPGESTGTIEVKAEKGGGMGSCRTTIIVMR